MWPRSQRRQGQDQDQHRYQYQYQYRRLNAEKHEIRVLDVAHTEFVQDKVSCRIRHVSLDSRELPNYEAISYCWGDPNPCHQILLNGQEFSVSKPQGERLLDSGCKPPLHPVELGDFIGAF